VICVGGGIEKKGGGMAKEILAIPEEFLADVIRVIRAGLEHVDYCYSETREQLNKWCDEETQYLSVEFTDDEWEKLKHPPMDG